MRKILQRIIFAILANALALYAVGYFLQDQGFEVTQGILGYVMVGCVLGILNTFIRPLLKIIGFPLVFLSMGLFLIVINAIILFFTEYFFNTLFPETFNITFNVGTGVVAYFLAAVLLSLANIVTHWIFKSK